MEVPNTNSFYVLYREIPNPVFLLRKKGDDFILEDCNDAALEITEGGIKELIGRSINVIYTKVPQIYSDLLHCYNTRSSIVKEVPHTFYTTGEKKTLLVKCVFVPRDTILVYIEDKSNLKENERNIATLESAVEQSIDGVAKCDLTLKLTYVNKSFARMHGYKRDEMLRMKIEYLHNDRQMDDYRKAIHKIMSDGSWHGEIEHTRKDGTVFPTYMSITVLKNDSEDPTGLLAVTRDVTDLKKAEEEISKQNAKLQQLERQRNEIEKLATTGRMAALIAHDINNPLGGIQNSLLLLEDSISDANPYYKYIGRMKKELDRIACIVRHTYDLYRIDQTGANSFSISKCIEEVINLLESTWRSHGVRVEFADKRSLLTAVLPEVLFRQILYNVVQNAIEASSSGGAIKIHIISRQKYFDVTVQDFGSGISEEFTHKIFDQFFTTKNDGRNKHLGLGLSISKNIIESMHGSMSVSSKVGEGTTFRITLPINGYKEN